MRPDAHDLVSATREVLKPSTRWAARKDGTGVIHSLASKCPGKPFDVDAVDLMGERCWCTASLPLAARVAGTHADLVAGVLEKVLVLEDAKGSFARFACLEELDAMASVLEPWPVAEKAALHARLDAARASAAPRKEELLEQVPATGELVVVLHTRRSTWGGGEPSWAEWALKALGADGDSGLVVVEASLWEAVQSSVADNGGRLKVEGAGPGEGLGDDVKEVMLQLWLEGCPAHQLREVAEAL